jgi:carbamate kinase
MLELGTIRVLVGNCTIVVCAGGGGIPVVRGDDGRLRGAEAVIDKDLGAALLARQLGADALLLLTDVDGVEVGFGTPGATLIRKASVAELRAGSFPDGSMGPKVEAACRFVEATGSPAMIGRLDDGVELLRGTRGTTVIP